jgi:hypothetical protein
MLGDCRSDIEKHGGFGKRLIGAEASFRYLLVT